MFKPWIGSEYEVTSYHAGKETANRVLLPARRFHNVGDRSALGLLE